MSILIIINDAPYGTEKAFNALRMAMTLKKQTPELKLRIFLLADSVGCGLPGQKIPAGYYNIETMLKSLISKGVEVKACGLCLEARGLMNLDLIEGVQRSNMIEFTEWVRDSDKVITF
jgi:uncharacterized protein involved in oxidation of intracellular sulfur